MKAQTGEWLKAANHDLIVVEHNIPLLETLDKLYIDSRYPGEFGLLPNGKPTLQDAREFYRFAQDIYTTVCARLERAGAEEASHAIG